MINYIPRRFTVIRDKELCINCGCCVRQCSNECHFFDEDGKTVLVNSKNCVACHRCVDLCPTGALRIEKYVCDYRDNANWTPSYQQEICRQAETGSVLLSAMGNPKPYPIYWDKILLNASQVTNPSIDPLREPMEIRTILGRKPDKIEVEKKGKSITEMPPQVMLETPIMFSAMSCGSISLIAQKSLAMAAVELGTLFNTGEGGLHPDLRSFGDYAVVQVASGRFGVHKDYLNNSKFVEIKIGQGAKPGIGGHLPGEKVNVEVSNARMIPEGSDAISPATIFILLKICASLFGRLSRLHIIKSLFLLKSRLYIILQLLLPVLQEPVPILWLLTDLEAVQVPHLQEFVIM